MFDQFDDLFLNGAFAPRAVLLRGLTLEQVGARPASAPHSIFQALWHVTTVLRKSLDGGRSSWSPGRTPNTSRQNMDRSTRKHGTTWSGST